RDARGRRRRPGLRRHGQQLHGERGLLGGGTGRVVARRSRRRTHDGARRARHPRAGRLRRPRGPAGMSDGTERARVASKQEVWMGEPSADRVELVVRTMAQTAVDNEKYFGDLDAVVGDGDFGYSMARGFEIVLSDWDSFDRTDIGTFLKKIAVVITSRVGCTSGPIWGTALLRAGAVAGDKAELTSEDAIAMLRASIEGIKKRGNSD